MHFILRVISLKFLSFIFASIYGFFHAKKIHMSVGPFFEIFHIQPIFAKKGPNWEKLILKMYDSQHIQLFCCQNFKSPYPALLYLYVRVAVEIGENRLMEAYVRKKKVIRKKYELKSTENRPARC